MRYVRSVAGLVGAVGLIAAASSARATTLADLISGGGSFTAGNLVFSNISVSGALPASAITVNFVPNTGVQFTANWNTLAPGMNSTQITYDLTSTANNVNGASLFFAGQVVVNGGSAAVNETLSDTAHSKNYNLSVFYDGTAANKLRDTVAISPETNHLHIVKSISVNATGANSFAALNFVENTFTQGGAIGQPPPVPEPMSLALLPLALVGLGLRKKFANNNNVNNN